MTKTRCGVVGRTVTLESVAKYVEDTGYQMHTCFTYDYFLISISWTCMLSLKFSLLSEGCAAKWFLIMWCTHFWSGRSLFSNKSYQLRHKRSFIISYKTCRKTCVTNKGYFFFGLLGSGAPRENVAFCVALSYTCVSPFFVIFCTVFPLTHSLFLLIARMQNHLQCNGKHRLLRCCCHDRRFCLANRHTATEWHSVAVFGVRVQFKRNVWWTPGVHGIHAVRGIVYWNPSWRNILRSYHRASRWTIKKVKGNKK